jgi:hypothetical protein
MASDGEKHEWLPERTENILGTEPAPTSTGNMATTTGSESSQNEMDNAASSRTETYGSIVKDDADDERPKLQHTQSSSTATEDEKNLGMRRTQTGRSARETRQFEPIRTGDAEELTRIASSFEGAGGSITRTSTARSGLQRRDTLAGVNLGDPVLDPKSPEFDPYKWARM